MPLVAATKGNPMEKSAGLIPVTETLFTTYNIAISELNIKAATV